MINEKTSIFAVKTTKKMNTLTVRDFRNNMAATFERTDAGEDIFIRRGKKIYAIIPVKNDDLAISPSLQQKIDKARKEFENGGVITFKSASDAQKWMDEL